MCPPSGGEGVRRRARRQQAGPRPPLSSSSCSSSSGRQREPAAPVSRGCARVRGARSARELRRPEGAGASGRPPSSPRPRRACSAEPEHLTHALDEPGGGGGVVSCRWPAGGVLDAADSDIDQPDQGGREQDVEADVDGGDPSGELAHRMDVTEADRGHRRGGEVERIQAGVDPCHLPVGVDAQRVVGQREDQQHELEHQTEMATGETAGVPAPLADQLADDQPADHEDGRETHHHLEGETAR